MKKLVLLFSVILSCTLLNAQETYIVNGETIELKLKVDGEVDFLMSAEDNVYRYFIRTADNEVLELLNTRDDQDNFKEEYKAILEKATSGMSAANVRFTYPSISSYIETYDKGQDDDFEILSSKWKVQKRLSVFGGITNSPFVTNPENIKTPLFGAEFEVSEDRDHPRHSAFLQVRHILEDKNEFPYSTTELSLGYRFRFINTRSINLFADVKAATINFSKSVVDRSSETAPLFVKESNTAFDIPFIFGLGADVRLSDTSFITIGFNQLVALFLENQGNFPTDITLGYRMKL